MDPVKTSLPETSGSTQPASPAPETDGATMDLSTLFDVPEGTHLTLVDGAIVLFNVRRDHADRLTVARYPLGADQLDHLLQLLDSIGLAPRCPEEPAAATATPVEDRATQADDPNTTPCPECGNPVRTNNYRRHLRLVHGIEAPRKRRPAGESAKPCPQCGEPVTAKNLAGHLESAHGQPRRAPGRPWKTPIAQQPDDEAARRGSCDLCGHPWPGHPRCDECAGLIGRGHSITSPAATRRGKPLCMACHLALEIAGTGYVPAANGRRPELVP